MSFRDFLTTLNIPWATGGPNGQAYWGVWGDVFDDQADRVKQAVKAHMPTLAPSDALPFLGNERQFDRGPTESDAAYALRLQGSWEVWRLAGTAIGLLIALHYAGFPGAIVVQQNGLGCQWTPPSNPAADLASTMTVTDLNGIVWPLYGIPSAVKVIPIGQTWWVFDGNTDLCSRFAVLFPGGLPGGAWTTWASAAFTGAEDGGATPWPLATWSNAFPDSTYKILCGPPTITDGDGPVLVAPDPITKTTTAVRVSASASFTGSVDLLAYQAAATNPFANPHPNDLARLRRVIAKWRPAKAACVGIYVVTQGKCFGWPVRTWGSGDTLGPFTVVSFTA